MKEYPPTSGNFHCLYGISMWCPLGFYYDPAGTEKYGEGNCIRYMDADGPACGAAFTTGDFKPAV